MSEYNLARLLVNTDSQSKWKSVGVCKRAGILVPLFSIYSKNSAGIGDFQDLKLLIDWARKTGNSIIQLLPVTEMGSTFCPYDSISSFALEPAYFSFQDVQLSKNKAFADRIKEIKKLYPCSVDYIDFSIKKEKIKLLWNIFSEKNDFRSVEFEKFIGANEYWLLDFSLFKALKDFHNGRAWYEWDEKFKNHDKQALSSFHKEHKKEIDFQMWLQWQLYEQLKSVRLHSLEKNKKVLLKGDLPILVSRDSADVWAHPEFFKLEFAAGAPPDMYCAKGQRWGMPTYNWDKIEADDFTYLKEKLRFAQEFYDILRIDHVVGLFRIWSIPYEDPLENKGLNGFFDPKDENLWGERGRKILSVMLENTRMLICAEDLGTIPKVCTDTLKELGIPGNDVQRWVKDWNVKHDFLEPKDYRALSVAMLSTHDTTNWPAWWENEAGTVDEALFMRKCNERKIDYEKIKDELFDFSLSRHARLRWNDGVNSIDKFVTILNKGRLPNEALAKEHLLDFIDIYQNTYQEKEKLWKHFNLKGELKQKSDSEIVRAALRITLESNAVFCINLIFDWLFLDDILKGDPYKYRINFPGTKSGQNWSLTLPISLEELSRSKITKQIHNLVKKYRDTL